MPWLPPSVSTGAMTTKGRIGVAALKKMKKGFTRALRTLDRCFTQITGAKLNERRAETAGRAKAVAQDALLVRGASALHRVSLVSKLDNTCKLTCKFVVY